MLAHQAQPIEVKKKKLVISLDFDGCYIFIKNDKIANHDSFHKFIVDMIQRDNYDEVYLLVGSARQSRTLDVYSHKENENGSITQSLPNLQSYLQNAVSCPVKIIPWLLEDVMLGYKEPQQFSDQKSFIEDTIPPGGFYPWLNTYDPFNLNDKKVVSKTFNTDKEKLSIILFQTHLISDMNPGSMIEFIFVDDMADQFSEAFKRRIEDRNLLPNNLDLKFLIYSTSCTPQFTSNSFNGTGANHLISIKENLMEQLRNHKDKVYFLILSGEKLLARLQKEKNEHQSYGFGKEYKNSIFRPSNDIEMKEPGINDQNKKESNSGQSLISGFS